MRIAIVASICVPNLLREILNTVLAADAQFSIGATYDIEDLVDAGWTMPEDILLWLTGHADTLPAGASDMLNSCPGLVLVTIDQDAKAFSVWRSDKSAEYTGRLDSSLFLTQIKKTYLEIHTHIHSTQSSLPRQ